MYDGCTWGLYSADRRYPILQFLCVIRDLDFTGVNHNQALLCSTLLVFTCSLFSKEKCSCFYCVLLVIGSHSGLHIMNKRTNEGFDMLMAFIIIDQSVMYTQSIWILAIHTAVPKQRPCLRNYLFYIHIHPIQERSRCSVVIQRSEVESFCTNAESFPDIIQGCPNSSSDHLRRCM